MRTLDILHIICEQRCSRALGLDPSLPEHPTLSFLPCCGCPVVAQVQHNVISCGMPTRRRGGSCSGFSLSFSGSSFSGFSTSSQGGLSCPSCLLGIALCCPAFLLPYSMDSSLQMHPPYHPPSGNTPASCLPRWRGSVGRERLHLLRREMRCKLLKNIILTAYDSCCINNRNKKWTSMAFFLCP